MTAPGDICRRAAAFATRAHRHETRSDGKTPYAAHPASVAMLLASVFGCADETALAIAWLHDTIEDTTTDYEDLRDAFGEDVARGVAALSKVASLPQQQREDAADDALRAADWRARLVRLGDVLDNMCSGAGLSPEKRARLIGRAERALAAAERDRAEHRDVNRACAVVATYLEIFKAH